VLTLTLTLIATPWRGWGRLRAAHDAGIELPPPLSQVAVLSGVSIAATFVGAAVAPGASVGRVTVSALSAVTAYLGAAVCATQLAPALAARWLPRKLPAPLMVRHAAASASPAAASGLLHPFFEPAQATVYTAATCLWTCATAYWGARILLDLSGTPRATTAAVTAALACAPLLASASACLL